MSQPELLFHEILHLKSLWLARYPFFHLGTEKGWPVKDITRYQTVLLAKDQTIQKITRNKLLCLTNSDHPQLIVGE